MNPLEFINQIKDMYNDQDPRSMAQGPRNMYQDGQLVTPSVDGARPGYRGDKTQEVLKAYKEYKKSHYRSRHKYPIIPFTKFFEMYAKENFADGGSAGQLVTPSVDGSRPGYRGDIEKTKRLNLIKSKIEPLNLGEKQILYKSYDNLFKQEYKRLLSLGDPFSKTDLNRAVINKIVKENPTINLQEGIGLDKIPGGGNEESKTLFERYDKTSARGPLFNKKELAKFTQGNQTNAMVNTKTQERIFNAIFGGNSDRASLAKKLRISEGRLDYNVEKLMRTLAKESDDQYIFLKKFKEKDLEKVRNSIFESPSLEQSYQRTISQSILQSTALGSPERKKAFQKLKEFRKFKQVMVENGLDPKLLSMDHAASYRAIKNGNIKNFLSVTPIMKDINTLKSSFDRRSQLNLRRMRDYLLAGDTKNYKYFLKNQTELENLWKTMTGGQSSLGKIRVTATGPKKGKIKIYDYGSTSLLDKNKNLLDELANNLDIRKNIVNASTTKNLDDARRIMLEGSELTEKKMLGTMKKTDRAPKTVIDKSFQALDKPEMFKAEKQIKKLLTSLCPKRKAAASGGRIGYATGTAVTGTLECGQEAFTKLVNSKNKTPAQISTIKSILNMGANAMKGLGKSFSPAEMLKLRNLVGPGAWAAMGAFEAGAIGYDTINNNTPLNEALSNNWVTGWAMPWTKKEAQIKNLEEANISDSPAMQKYMEEVKLMADYERQDGVLTGLKNRYGDQERAKVLYENQQGKLDNIVGKWHMLQGTSTATGGEMDFREAVSDMEEKRGAGEYVEGKGYEDVAWKPFGFGKLKAKETRVPTYDLPPSIIGKKDFKDNVAYYQGKTPFKGDTLTVARPKRIHTIKNFTQPNYRTATTTPLNANQLQAEAASLRDIGILEPRGEMPQWYIDQLQQQEKWRQLFEQSPTGLFGSKFASGGRAGYMGGGIAAIRKPHAIPPKRQGLRSIMINVNDD